MFFRYQHICWFLVVLINNVIDVGHIHGEDDYSEKLWVPKKMCPKNQKPKF